MGSLKLVFLQRRSKFNGGPSDGGGPSLVTGLTDGCGSGISISNFIFYFNFALHNNT